MTWSLTRFISIARPSGCLPVSQLWFDTREPMVKVYFWEMSSISVALPGGGAVRLEHGGLATSGSVRRRWRRGGREQHHLIDPATGLPSESPWTQVTVSGRSCLDADVAAKAGFLLGAEGPGWLTDRFMPARLLAGRGETLTPAWREAVTAGSGRPRR